MLVIAGTRAPEEEEDDECSQLSILGFASASQVKDLQDLQQLFQFVSDLQVVVNVANEPTPPGVVEACESCWSCCHRTVATTVPERDLPLFEQLLHNLAEGRAPARLQLAEHRECWVSSSGDHRRAAAQIEGFASQVQRAALGRFERLAAVVWYSSEWQAQLLEVRWLAGPNPHGWRRPEAPLRLVEASPLEDWLLEQECLVGSMIVPSMPKTLPWKSCSMSAPGLKVETLADCEEGRVLYIPELLAHEECQQFVALALCFHQPAAQPATIVPLPPQHLSTMDDSLTFVLCPGRESAAPAALLWEAPQRHGVRRCGGTKLTVWLSPCNGEAVFPWLQAGTEEHATLSVGDACARLTADAENDHVLRVEMRQGAALLVEGSESRAAWHVQSSTGAWTLQKLWVNREKKPPQAVE
ncbi:unnamed protein product [Durusdinium trenchii]|uniref:Uncharacterized protein n=2 Tax=Durusdinium trenchii TaxID=1381693 RepID=A0ABP0RGB7_9DINO